MGIDKAKETTDYSQPLQEIQKKDVVPETSLNF